ncbi:MAG: lysine--tRNA ligase [Candidatus Competibacteraceae bacterium]|nr:lysine--tRNA ligase [Candidatus Competibacteraceae bacterium]
MVTDQYMQRRQKNLAAWRESHPQLVRNQFLNTNDFRAAKGAITSKTQVPKALTFRIAGRVVLFRTMGRLSFGQLQSGSERIQFSLNQSVLNEDLYKFIVKHIDLGDHIGVVGEGFVTQKGEPTVRATEVFLLNKALRPLPEKFAGLQDPEAVSRQRYLKLATDPDEMRRFQTRSAVIRNVANILESAQFAPIETPILQGVASGAAARPFVTHHNSLDMNLYLRIAPEVPLKMAMAGGYEAVYEIGKNFRNEGMDSSHLQEFTMCEFYRAYWNWKDAIDFTESMILNIVSDIKGQTVFDYQGETLQFKNYSVMVRTPMSMIRWDYPSMIRWDYRQLVLYHTGIDFEQHWSLEAMRQAVIDQGIELEQFQRYSSFGSLLDALFKKFVRPHLIQPCWVIRYPRELAPLAAANIEDPRYVDKFQMVVNGWEIVNGYTELVDPELQRHRLEEQQALARGGEQEAVALDEDFLLAMEHGMPPMAGVGIGIDRLVAILTDSPSIRDVVLFPNVRAKNSGD